MTMLLRRLLNPLVCIAPGYKKAIKMAIDCGSIFISFQLAYYLRFDMNVPSQYAYQGLPGGLFLAAISMVLFGLLGAYSDFWVYWSLRDSKKLLLGHTGLTCMIMLINSELRLVPVPLSIWLIYWIVASVFFSGSRLIARTILETRLQYVKKKKRVLIIGAGRAGQMLIWQVKSDQSHQYQVVGLIDDDPAKLHRSIHGVEVCGDRTAVCSIARQKAADMIIIAVPSATSREMRAIVREVEACGIPFSTVPGPRELLDGRVYMQKLRDVNIDDLIGRGKSVLDETAIRGLIENKVILVTGAAGSIGSQLCREIIRFHPAALVALDKDENKLFYLDHELKDECRIHSIVAHANNENKMRAVINKYEPSVIFHAAAYKHVPCMEACPEEAIFNNLYSTMVVANLAAEFGVNVFVQISTDKAVNPVNVMGVSKRLCELYVRYMHNTGGCRFLSVRFGNVIGSVGSVFTIFEKQIKKDLPITITDPEMTRFFMSISEACKLVLESASLQDGGHTYILNMEEPVKIIDMARQMITLSGLVPYKDIPIKIIGARPGEKIHEELWYPYEIVTRTANSSIFKATSGLAFSADFIDSLVSILNDAHSMHIDAMIEKIRKIVPEYQPSGSLLHETGISRVAVRSFS